MQKDAAAADDGGGGGEAVAGAAAAAAAVARPLPAQGAVPAMAGTAVAFLDPAWRLEGKAGEAKIMSKINSMCKITNQNTIVAPTCNFHIEYPESVTHARIATHF